MKHNFRIFLRNRKLCYSLAINNAPENEMTDLIKNLTVNQIVKLLKDQAYNIPQVGDMLFGEVLNTDHVQHAITELARIATLYAAEINNRNDR